MKEKMLTSSVIEDIYCVLGKRSVRAVDTDCLFMNGIEYAIVDDLSEDHIQYVLSKYSNIAIYKRDKLQCIAVFPRDINLLYNN